jgi:hypothetical protein
MAAISGGATIITGGAGAYVFGAILTNGTTAPQFARAGDLGTTGDNFGLTAPPYRWARGSVGGITTLPASITVSTINTVTTDFWFGLY